MNIKLSIEFQKRAGSYERNLEIKADAKVERNYAKIGRKYGLSRERIRQIVDREDEIKSNLFKRLFRRS